VKRVVIATRGSQLARKELTRDQQRELVQRVVQLVINKLLHVPTSVLRESDPDLGALRAAIACELFGLEPTTDERPAP